MNESKYASELISWSSSFSVGITLIDDQHKKLLELTNALFNHCVGNDESERLYFKEVIDAAVDYVNLHFATEEKIMQFTNFQGFREHRKAHNQFKTAVMEQVQRFEDGRPFSLIAFTKFLKNWILTHIAVCDKQYFEYFKKIATRKSNGKLSITAGDVPLF
ncbi:hemerythrin [Spirochaetia bacterium]|nr:hemerythrin [Spirochaetia bacterium]GHU33810.1 hemerythrin [Spirochaetia bacterium]